MASPRNTETPRTPDRLVAVFGFFGLLPFWAPLAVARLSAPYAGWALGLQAVYAGLILSFLGGARFGRALTTPGSGAVVAIAMLPSIFALAVLALPVSHAIAHLMLAAALAAAWLWDLAARDLPASYKRLRTALTGLGALALLGGAWMLQMRPGG